MTRNIKQEVKVTKKPTNCYSGFQRMFKSNMALSAAIMGLMAAPIMNSNASLSSFMRSSNNITQHKIENIKNNATIPGLHSLNANVNRATTAGTNIEAKTGSNTITNTGTMIEVDELDALNTSAADNLGANGIDNLMVENAQEEGGYVDTFISKQVNRALYLPRIAWNAMFNGAKFAVEVVAGAVKEHPFIVPPMLLYSPKVRQAFQVLYPLVSKAVMRQPRVVLYPLGALALFKGVDYLRNRSHEE